MKILLLSIIILVVYNDTIISQCANEDFYFTRQSQIDSFPLLYPGCDSVFNLSISGADITDLGPLSSIKYVGDYFVIVDNPLLQDLQGLHNVEHGGSSLEIEYNESLQTLNGLSSLKSVFGFVDIVYNPHLKNLQGLEMLSSVGGFIISENDSLQTLGGLEGVTGEPWIYITDNQSLRNLDGLQNLMSVGFFLIINNYSLINLDALENMRTIGELVLTNNSNLESITGLNNVTVIDVAISIVNNPVLTECGIDYFCEGLYQEFQINQIEFNGLTCASLDAILASCTTSSSDSELQINYIDDISIFPNPSAGSFFLQFDVKENTKGHIEIFNSQYQLFFSQNISQLSEGTRTLPVNLKSLEGGIYFLRLFTDQGSATRKLVIVD